MAGRWRLLLSAIGVTMAEMDVIQLKHPNHPKLCLLEGLEQWMVSSDSPCTFGKLLSALRGKVAPNLPLADRVEEFAKMKAAAPTFLSEPAASSPASAGPGKPSPGLRGQETVPHESSTPPPNPPVVVEASSTEPAKVAMNPKVLPPPSSPTITCDTTRSEPEPSKVERPSFPLLPTGKLTVHQKFALVGRLQKETTKIQREFSSLVFKATDFLKDRVDLSQFVWFLMEFTLLQHRKGDEIDCERDLQKAKSFYDVYKVIRPFYSFFGYGLIEDIIANFGTDDDKQRLAAYEEHFNEYCKRRVYECPVGALGRASKEEILVVAKLNKELEKFTLEAAAEFGSKLCEILKLPDGSLRFIGAEKGCIELHFAVLSSLELATFPLSSHQRERLQGVGVMELRGRTHCYNLQEEGEATSEERSTTEEASVELPSPIHKFFINELRKLDPGEASAEEGSTAEEAQSEGSEVESEPDLFPVPTGDIVKAARHGDTARVVALLEQGVPVDTRGVWENRTPLMWAAWYGHPSTMEALLSHGAGVNLRDKDGRTPLMLAATRGHTAIVRSLLGGVADLTIHDKDGGTALQHAAFYGRTATVEELVAAGANLNIANRDGHTPLILAANVGYTATVESLLGRGADLTVRDKGGWTALHHAAYYGRTATVEVLVDDGASVNIVDYDGQTPLILASTWGFTATVDSLVGRGADLNIQLKDGKTALIRALLMQNWDNEYTIPGKLASAELLVKAGAKLNHREKKSGRTALFFAAKEGSLSLVRLLLERGADPTGQDKEGVTAYDVAQTYGHESVMEELERCTPRKGRRDPAPDRGATDHQAKANDNGVQARDLLAPHSH